MKILVPKFLNSIVNVFDRLIAERLGAKVKRILRRAHNLPGVTDALVTSCTPKLGKHVVHPFGSVSARVCSRASKQNVCSERLEPKRIFVVPVMAHVRSAPVQHLI